MEIILEKIITRLDAEAFQDILGKEVIGTLFQMGAEYSYSDGLRKILSNTYSNEELLKNSISRNHIIDSLRKDEIEILSKNMNLTIESDYWDNIKNIDYKSNNLKILFDFFGEKISQEIEHEWIQEFIINPNYPLYPYQRQVLKKINTVLNSNKNTSLYCFSRYSRSLRFRLKCF